ncbi:MAG: response regulator [Verrucomicrobiota bacterium]
MSTGEQQSEHPPHVEPKLIYVVDDEPMIGDVVQIILRMDGYCPKFFQDPELALQALIGQPAKPSLLLTDFRMSPINGMELIDRAKNHFPTLRTILYSGNAGEDILEQYRVRPDAFLRKPFLPRTLLSLVRSTLKGSGPSALVFLGALVA